VLYRRWRPAGAVPVVAIVALACVCFARLVTHPAALIVDGDRPSIDHAIPGQPRYAGNDATFSFLPHHLSIARVFRTHGHLPQWDDRGFGGRPLVGNPQGGMFYPPVWLVWWSGAPAALGWLTVGHLLWGGIGMYALVRSFQVGRWAATVAAAVYQASPLLLAHTFEGHYPHVWAACWYPWAFWAYGQRRTGNLRGQMFLPVILALIFLTGHPQEWFLLVLGLTAWSVYDSRRMWQAYGPHRSAGHLMGWTALFALSVGLAAVDVSPELAVRPWLASNPDAPVGVEIPKRYHLWYLSPWQLLSPTALGGPADYFGDDNYWETVFSIGLVPLFLAVVGALRHPDRGLVRGWLALAGLAIWLACGRHFVLFTMAYFTIPGMSWFRVPARALFLANVAGAVLAGLGIDALRRQMTHSREWRQLATQFSFIVLMFLAGVFSFLFVGGTDGSSRTVAAIIRVLTNGCFWLALAGSTASVHLGSLFRSPKIRRRATELLGLLALCELGWYGFSLIRVAPSDRFLGDDPVGTALIRLDRDSHGPHRVRIKARDSSYSDLRAAVLGIEKTNINDVFQLEHAARLYQVLYPVASFQRRRLNDAMQEAVNDYKRQIRQAIFDRMSVGYLVSNQYESDPGWPQENAITSRWTIQRNPTVMPRAYVVPTATVNAQSASATLARFRDVDPRETVFMNFDPLVAVPRDRRQPFAAAEWTSDDPDHPVVEVTIEAPGLLVITDTWMPGWTARVDGEPTPVFQGNLAQRVVPLWRRGRHTIALDYQAPGFTLGCGLTALSFLTWVFMSGLMINARSNTKMAIEKGSGRPPRSRPRTAEVAVYPDYVKYSGQPTDLRRR
jgi:hypothetical protein